MTGQKGAAPHQAPFTHTTPSHLPMPTRSGTLWCAAVKSMMLEYGDIFRDCMNPHIRDIVTRPHFVWEIIGCWSCSQS